jgi:putative transposase
VKYAWIKDHRDSFPVVAMCRVLRVSKSGYYKSLKAEPSLRMLRAERIRTSIKQVYEESHQIYGSYKIADQLGKDDRLEVACRNTVATAMREMGLKSRVSKKFTPTTTVSDPSKIPAPNILNQTFTADAPNQKWVTDITYLPTQLGWVYLAVVLDLFSRKVVGWSISDSLATPLVSTALRNAIEARRPDTNSLLHHSDRGTQYTSDDYQQTLRTLNITCSMSRTGCCYDNAVMERFFWSLKHEWTKFEDFADINQTRTSVFQYIETFYNSKRIHQTLGYQTPDEFEERYQTKLAV